MPSSRRKPEAAATSHWRFRPVSQWSHESVGYQQSGVRDYGKLEFTSRVQKPTRPAPSRCDVLP